MSRYAYEDMSERQFEELVVAVGRQIFGIGLQGFAQGPDGGRDAKFVGTAEYYPSAASPWTGKTILQAKHTNAPYKNFSEADFYSETSSETVLGKEMPRVRNLRFGGELDNYMIVSNRRLTGGAESKLRKVIAEACGIAEACVAILGTHDLDAYLKMYPDAAEQADVDPIDCPLIVSPDDLAEVVEALAASIDDAITVLESMPVDRVSYDAKNEANNMSPAYAKRLRDKYLKDCGAVKDFLASPENARLLELYETAAEDFELKIIAKRKDYQSFDEVMNRLFDLLIDRDPVLRKRKRLTRLMVFYMYWNCDIGGVDDAETE